MQTHVVLSIQAEICIIFSLGQGGGIQLYMEISYNLLTIVSTKKAFNF